MRRAETYEMISNAYHNWLIEQVDMLRSNRKRLEQKLMNTEYVPLLERDENRAADGEDLKYRFAYENGYEYYEVEDAIGCGCSMLEMMVALCLRCQDYISACEGDRTVARELFNEQLSSMGLARYTDRNYDEERVSELLARFMDGYGNLFGGESDRPRTTELWTQAMHRLDEMIFEGCMTL